MGVCFALGSWPLSASIDMPICSIAVKGYRQLSFDHPLYRQRHPPLGTGIAHIFPGPCTGRDWGVVAHFCVALERFLFFAFCRDPRADMGRLTVCLLTAFSQARRDSPLGARRK